MIHKNAKVVKKRIKILHVIYSFNTGGLENGLVNLINHLPCEQFAHTICVLSEGKSLLSRIKRDVDCHELHKRNGNDLLLPFKIAAIIRNEKIDIVHTRNWVSLVEGLSGAAIGGCRRVVHSEHGKEIEDTTPQPLRRKIAKKMCFVFAKKVVTVSRSLKEEFESNKLCDISKIMTIINGVDCDKFNIKAQQDVLKFRRLYGIPENAFVIGSVGRLAKIKNFSFLLNIIRECQDLFLVLVGDGPERTSLLQKVNEMSLANRCLFLGELKDISKVLSTFDVFANTSLYEGISNTILEAMASGIPVVANNVGGTPEIVSNGTTGFLIDANSKDKFINIFMKLKNNEALRQNVGVNSRKIVEGKYSLQSMVAKYQHIYNSLI